MTKPKPALHNGVIGLIFQEKNGDILYLLLFHGDNNEISNAILNNHYESFDWKNIHEQANVTAMINW